MLRYLLLTACCLALHASNAQPSANQPRIQVALLLDVSGSMEGLLNQARTQIWNMVGILGRADCSRGTPKIEIALYQYGQISSGPKADYIEQVKPFTTSLDSLSSELFALRTTGSEEWCATAIHRAVSELHWDAGAGNYKVLFIAGNENFRQGNYSWEKACAEARAKGIIVNTIHCGEAGAGLRDFWNLGTQCGSGAFTNIDADQTITEPPTPYDSTLLVLNEKLNGTMMAFGRKSMRNDNAFDKSPLTAQKAFVKRTDSLNKNLGTAANMKRIAVKANSRVYNNVDDLVSLYANDPSKMIAIDTASYIMDDTLSRMKPEERLIYISKKSEERTQVQKEISEQLVLRNGYLADLRREQASNSPTLQSEIEKLLVDQLKRNGFFLR